MVRRICDLRDDGNVGLAFFLAFVAEVLVEHLVAKPLEAAAPYTPRWWLIYVSLVVGAVLGWFFEANVFAVLAIPALVGCVLTALLIGGGTQVLHKVVNKAQAPVYSELGCNDVTKSRAGWLTNGRPSTILPLPARRDLL